MAVEYPWYKTVSNKTPLEQGDFINNCSVVHPKTSKLNRKLKADVIQYDVVVMTQSCDLLAGKVDLVLVCPIWPLSEQEKIDPNLQSNNGKERLKRGYYVANLMLNKCDLKGFEFEYMIVDFKSVYSVPISYITDLAEKQGDRVRLLPPYREGLSQAFAKFFMRVGYPVDIPSFI